MDKDGKKTGGRKKGVLNKSTQDIKVLASEYGLAVITELARLATDAVNEQTRVSACKEILDRIYGRPSQSIEQTIDTSIVKEPLTDLELARQMIFFIDKTGREAEKAEKAEKALQGPKTRENPE
jgi:hypothetical protein